MGKPKAIQIPKESARVTSIKIELSRTADLAGFALFQLAITQGKAQSLLS